MPPDRDAAIEWHLHRLLQIATRGEAEAFIASKFARAGRPLPPGVESGFQERDSLGYGPIDADEFDSYSPATKRAFWTGAVAAAAVLAAMLWLAWAMVIA